MATCPCPNCTSPDHPGHAFAELSNAAAAAAELGAAMRVLWRCELAPDE